MSTESAGEQLLNAGLTELRATIEHKMARLNPIEVSGMSGKVPVASTMWDERELRTNFLDRFLTPVPIDKPVAYSDELFQRHQPQPRDRRGILKRFFEKEVDRVNKIARTVERRYLDQENDAETCSAYAKFMSAISSYTAQCETRLMQASATGTLVTVTADDLFIELNYVILRRKRRAMLKSFLAQTAKLPVTSRQPVLQTFFEDLEAGFRVDAASPAVPVLVKVQSELNHELKRLGNRFGVNTSLEVSDGHEFIFYATKIFERMWPQLMVFECQKKRVDVRGSKWAPTMDDLTQQAVLSEIPRDMKLQKLVTMLAMCSADETSSYIRESTHLYNTTVGNHVRGQEMTHEHMHDLLRTDQLVCRLHLCFLHMKFVACVIMCHLNYFEYIQERLISDVELPYKVRRSSAFKEFIDVRDDTGPFLYESAVAKYDTVLDDVVAIGSYYIQKHVSAGAASRGPDHETVLERLLEYELRFQNAKRCLIQALLEVYDQNRNDTVKQLIFDAVRERPKTNPNAFRSYLQGYTIAVDLMEKKASVMRSFVNAQICHERQVAMQSASTVPLFDRPVCLKAEKCVQRRFDESVPATPFEVYESLELIGDILSTVPNVSKEFCESCGVRALRLGSYMELAIWKHIEILFGKALERGLFPYDRASFKFGFLLSDSVNSLFTSPVVNGMEPLSTFLEGMNEGRKFRFVQSARMFMELTWKLQTLMLETNALQMTYLEQCEHLGLSERSVLLSSFKDVSKKEGFNAESSPTNDKIIDFALTEFEPLAINFCSATNVKDIIFTGNYRLIEQIVQFQTLHNTILEVAVRYNAVLVDSDFMVMYFYGVDNTPKSDVFLTSGMEMLQENDGENNNAAAEAEAAAEHDKIMFFRQFVAAQVFYESAALLRDNAIAQEDKSNVILHIKRTKLKARTMMATLAKQQENIDDAGLLRLYSDETICSFAPFGYKNEIIRLCALERYTLLSSAFVDTFLIGPAGRRLVNEAGRVDHFFYVPTWYECLTMMSTAPPVQQKMVLRPLVSFLIHRLQIISMARLECALAVPLGVALVSNYENQFGFGTPLFGKLLSEFDSITNARDINIGLEWIQKRVRFMERRLEWVVLQALHNSLQALKVGGRKGRNEPVILPTGKIAAAMKNVWMTMHLPLPADKNGMTLRRYIPLWHDEFFWECIDNDRTELSSVMMKTDIVVHNVVDELKPSAFTDIVPVFPGLIEFVSTAVCLLHMKFAYFLLLREVDEGGLSLERTVLEVTSEIFGECLLAWNTLIVAKVNDILVPKGEDNFRALTEEYSETKGQIITFDTLRQQMDQLVLANQIKRVDVIMRQFRLDLAAAKEDDVDSLRPPLLDTVPMLDIDIQEPFVVLPKDAKEQFEEEWKYAHAKLVHLVRTALDDCQLETTEEEGKVTTSFAGDSFEEKCMELSTVFSLLMTASVDDMHITWNQYLHTICSEMKTNDRYVDIVSAVAGFVRRRFDRRTEMEMVWSFRDDILRINSAQDELTRVTSLGPSVDRSLEVDMRGEFECLANDLSKEVEHRKVEFRVIEQRVFSGVDQKIENARLVRLVADPSTQTEGRSQEAINGENFERVEVRNQELRHEIIKMRIIKCFQNLTNLRYYGRKLRTGENDRKMTNQIAWSNRLQYEVREAELEQQVEETKMQHSEIEIELERVKQRLQSEKGSNIQLVQWKAKNIKECEELTEQLRKFQGIGDVNIDELVKRVNTKQEELDILMEQDRMLEARAERDIRKPMREIDRLRAQMIGPDYEEYIECLRHEGDAQSAQAITSRAVTIALENDSLRRMNASLSEKIEQLTLVKDQRSSTTKTFMDTTAQPLQVAVRGLARTHGFIIKPNVRASGSVKRT